MSDLPPTQSADTHVVMSRELNLHLEKDSDARLAEGWGEVFKWMDLCAAIACTKHARTGRLVTAQVDDMRILAPLYYGDMLTVHGQVNNSWNTSMEVEVRLEAENLLDANAKPRVICKSYFTFVLTKEGRARGLPKFIPSNAQHQQVFYEALERRQIRFRRREVIRSTSTYLRENDEVTKERSSDELSEGELPPITVKSMSESSIVSSVVVLPPNANPHGNTFGGQIMAWMEETARLASKKHARRTMYLCHIDDIHFIQPSTVGDWLTIKAQVNRVFGDSLEVGVRVESQSFIECGEVRHINSGYLTYSTRPPHSRYSPDPSTPSVPLPLVVPGESEREIKQYQDAIGRRRVRIARSAISNQEDVVTPTWSRILSRDLIFSNIKDLMRLSLDPSLNFWEMSRQDEISTCLCDLENMVLVKMEFHLENASSGHKAKDIFPYFVDFEYRRQWEKLLKSIDVVEAIDEQNDIALISFGESESEKNDLCVLRSWRTPDSGFSENQYLISSRSIIHPNVPEVEGIKRGFIQPSGFIISDDADNRIKVIYLMQMTGSTLQYAMDNIPHVTIQRFKSLREWFGNLPPLAAVESTLQ